MIFAAPGATFYPELDAAPTGLMGTLGVRILRNIDNVEVLPRTTLGITEAPAGSGHYTAVLIAPVDPGEYSVFWDTGTVTPQTTASEDLTVTLVPDATDVTPTVAEVAALLHARTTVRGGSEAGTFTDTSRPTADQAQAMIDAAVPLVLSSVGVLPTLAECPDAPTLTGAVRALITMRATLFVEPSLWPEQTTAGVSPYTALREQYEAELPRVVDAVRDCRESGAIVPGEGSEGGPANAAWAFPPPDGWDYVTW